MPVSGHLFRSELPVAERLDAVIQHLNLICESPTSFYRPEETGRWFVDDFCERGTVEGTEVGGERLYFSFANGAAIQTIREGIEQMPITPDEKGVLVASLIQAADQAANIASTYGAYLKQLKATAKKPLRLKGFPMATGSRATITRLDAVEFARATPGLRVLYLDPPYNTRQYAAYYHLLETIARWDRPLARGKTGVRPYGDQKSGWCSKRQALTELERVIAASDAEWIMLSYSDEGIMAIKAIEGVMEQFGSVSIFQEKLKRFRSDKDSATRQYSDREHVTEYLLCLRKWPSEA